MAMAVLTLCLCVLAAVGTHNTDCRALISGGYLSHCTTCRYAVCMCVQVCVCL